MFALFFLLSGITTTSTTGQLWFNITDCNPATTLCPNDTFKLSCSVNRTSNYHLSLEWRVILKIGGHQCSVLFWPNEKIFNKNCLDMSSISNPPCSTICNAELLFSSSTYYHSAITLLNVEYIESVVCGYPLVPGIPRDSCDASLEDEPGPLKNLQSLSSTCSTVQLKWDNPLANKTWNNITIFPHPDGGLCQTGNCNNTSSLNKINITSLHPSETYEVSVTACNCVGCGIASTLPIVLNATVKNPPRPENVTVNVINDTSVMVSWSINSFHDDCILQYTVDYGSQRLNVDNDDISCTITNLTKGSIYIFKVASKIDSVWSNWSEPTTIIFDVPMEVTNVISIPSVVECTSHSAVVSINITWETNETMESSLSYPEVTFYNVYCNIMNNSCPLKVNGTMALFIYSCSDNMDIINITIVSYNKIGGSLPFVKTVEVQNNLDDSGGHLLEILLPICVILAVLFVVVVVIAVVIKRNCAKFQGLCKRAYRLVNRKNNQSCNMN